MVEVKWASLFAPPGYEPGLFSDLVVECGASTPGLDTQGVLGAGQGDLHGPKTAMCNDAQVG